MYPELVVGVGSCFLEFVMGVDIYGIVVVVLGSSKIEKNVQWGECSTTKQICLHFSKMSKRWRVSENFSNNENKWIVVVAVAYEFSLEESIEIEKIINKKN